VSSDRGGYVIEVESLPGGENAVRFDGHEHGTNVSFFITRNRPGTGPDLHRHPYEETFIVQEGEARYTLGGETIEAKAGQIVIAPAGTPHKFVNTGRGVLRQVNIHPVPRMQTEWLE
jgi:quercetin dioxygenase-like cupin family protein